MTHAEILFLGNAALSAINLGVAVWRRSPINYAVAVFCGFVAFYEMALVK